MKGKNKNEKKKRIKQIFMNGSFLSLLFFFFSQILSWKRNFPKPIIAKSDWSSLTTNCAECNALATFGCFFLVCELDSQLAAACVWNSWCGPTSCFHGLFLLTRVLFCRRIFMLFFPKDAFVCFLWSRQENIGTASLHRGLGIEFLASFSNDDGREESIFACNSDWFPLSASSA